jgi:4-hydroxyphenylpyruvate dioxygenase
MPPRLRAASSTGPSASSTSCRSSAPTSCSSARTFRRSRSASGTVSSRTSASWGIERLRRGLRVGFEALAWGRHIQDHRQAWDIVREVNHPAVGLVLDSFSSLARKEPIDSLRSIDPAKLFHVQIADAPSLSMDPLSWSRHFRCMPGQGDLPLVEYVTALREIGYRGVLSLEIFNDRFLAGSAADVAVDGMRSLTYLLEQVSQHADRRVRLPAGRVHRVLRQRGGSVAARAHAADVGIRADRAASTQGSDPLAPGRHQPHRQLRAGRLCAFLRHGPRRIRVRDRCTRGGSAAALERAGGCRSAAFRSRGTGEFEIPAVRGVGGSLIYFVADADVDAIWRTEFEPCRTRIGADAGLKRVDHLAQSMQYEEMLSWLLYYVALFQVEKSPPTESTDPVGLVMSQACARPTAAFASS